MAIINGDNGDNFLTGTAFADTLRGFGGFDTIQGLGGADFIDGGAGIDRASYALSNAGVNVFLFDGSASGGDAEGDRLVGIENVTGSSFADQIWGDDGDNFIDGFGGDDILKGLGGNDSLRGDGHLEGNEGDDSLRGGFGADTLLGGEDDDMLDGREGADRLDGGAGFDTITYDASDAGVTVILGKGGSGAGGDAEGDRYFGIENVVGSFENDTVFGDDSSNRMEGLNGDDTLKGAGGSDDLRGGIGADSLQGGQGNDFLEGGFDADGLDGGAGVDTAVYFESNAGVVVSLAGTGSGGHAQGDTYVGIENVDGSQFADNISGDAGANRLYGDFGNDTLKGLGGADVLLGDAGADTLVGGDGDDWLEGQSGADQMVGGNGNDVYVVDSSDTVNETTGSGIDTVRSFAAFSLSSGAISGAVENLTLTGSASVAASGNALANTIVGNSGANSINGNSGADLMRGMGGDDSYVINESGDRVDEAAAGSSGTDRILSFVSLSLAGPQVSGNVENLDLSGTVNGAGNALGNVIRGSSGANDIAGKGGNDILTGGGGADVFVFDTTPNGATNRDVIEDFSVLQDTIRLENGVFTGLATGGLAASAFHIGTGAHDATDRIVYNEDTGALLFDRDGTGAVAAVRFATLDDDLAMTSADFLIV